MLYRGAVFFILIIFSLNIKAQQISQASTYKLYNKIIDAIGNNNPRAPKLVFKDSQSAPASYNPTKKTIEIENKVLEICYSFGTDSLNALSYIIAHELGHHYKDHGYTTKYASLDFIDPEMELYRDTLTHKKLDSLNKVLKIQKKIEHETQADVYAGFYSHLAGHDALSIASDFLDRIYKEYNLKEEIKGYPSLTERKEIIKKNKSDFAKLRDIFDLANLVMSVGQYDYAQELFQYIIDQGFTSREIYNNLGLCYVYEALSLDVEDIYFNVIIPFKIDLSTRLESNGSTRSAMTTQKQAIMLFNKAKKEFETATQLDDNYFVAKENLFFTDLALTYLGESVRSQITSNDLINENRCCKFCVEGHSALVNKKLSKAKKLFKKGSSKCNICDINTDFRNKQTPKTKKYQKTEFDLLEKVNGIDMYCEKFKPSSCDIYYRLTASKLCIKKHSEIKVYMLKKKKSCVSIQEIDNNNDKLKNSVDIYVGDNMNKLDNYQNLRIINSANSKYISILDKQLTFLVQNEKVTKWYYFERLN